MEKDFDMWNTKKKATHYQKDLTLLFFREYEIWWCRLGINIGHEQDGKSEAFARPVVILKKFNEHLFWAIPLSTKLKNNPYYLECLCSDGNIRAAILSQLRLVSAKRLTDKICLMKPSSFHELKKKIRGLL